MQIFALLAIFSLYISAGEISNELTEIKLDNLNSISAPHPVISNTASDTIAIYTCDELFSFESQAKAAAEKMFNIFRNYGITVLGYNIIEKGNDYSFTIEYIPILKNPETLNSVIIQKYISAASYWNENLAKKFLQNALTNFKNSPLKPIDSKTIEYGNNYSFYILYSANNILKKSKEYYVEFKKFNYGNYTFESQAEAEIEKVLNTLKQTGIAAIKGKVIPSGNDYAIEIEYLNKTNYGKNNPEYLIESYKCLEKFSFEDMALKESISRNEIFLKTGLKPLHNYTYDNEGDYSFIIDYAVKNIYKKEGIYKEYLIKRYNNPVFFDFESEAKKAMQEKTNNFNSAGLFVISSDIQETGNSYTFYLEYIEKQNIPQF